MDNLKFGSFIKELRKEKNMTQKELAEKIGLTDKAISKWERGLSFPDITMLSSLAEVFDVDVSEILNGERGKEKISKEDIEKKIEEAVEKVTLKKEKREKRIEILKRTVGIISCIVFAFTFLLQIGYLFVLKPRSYEYISDILFYIINEIIIITLGLIFLTLVNIKKNFIKNIITYVFLIILTIINITFMINNGFENKWIVEFSKDFSSELVLKKNNQTGEITYYKNTKVLFAKDKEVFSNEVEGPIKTQWLTNDICSITYKDKEGTLNEFVATYGDRGNGISYYYVTNAIVGEWQVFSQYGEETKVIVDSKGITIKKDGKEELFSYKDCKQYGTTAIVLYKNNIPCYVIALNEDCKLDEETDILENGGTITLVEVSIARTKTDILQCINYKGENLSNYNSVNVEANDYKIKNGILYISYDGESVKEVPGDFSDVQEFEDGTYQVEEEKSFFVYRNDEKEYLIYSDDMGINWNTVELGNTSVQVMQFVNTNVGFMLEFKDVAMGIAFGDIKKTTDGGKTWQVVFNGFGNEGEEVFRRGSRIKFFDENLGFMTMPEVSGNTSELYITRDGGISFTRMNVQQTEEDSAIYDYYELPEKDDDGTLTLEVGQGSDGDYEGGNSKIYYSYDEANTWEFKGVE